MGQGWFLMGRSKRGKHKSVDKELKPSLIWLESLPEVSKVVLGLCECARHAYAPGTLRYQKDVAGGIRIIAYGGNGIIDLYVKVAEESRADLISKIKDRWF
jgi:hypothetical protein